MSWAIRRSRRLPSPKNLIWTESSTLQRCHIYRMFLDVTIEVHNVLSATTAAFPNINFLDSNFVEKYGEAAFLLHILDITNKRSADWSHYGCRWKKNNIDLDKLLGVSGMLHLCNVLELGTNTPAWFLRINNDTTNLLMLSNSTTHMDYMGNIDAGSSMLRTITKKKSAKYWEKDSHYKLNVIDLDRQFHATGMAYPWTVSRWYNLSEQHISQNNHSIS